MGDSLVSPDVSELFVGRQPPSLIGRTDELTAIKALLLNKDVHLLTLTGVPGVGKTRLAVAVLSDMRQVFSQVILVDLAPLGSPAQVLPAIAHSCGVLEGVPGPLAQRLGQAVGSRRLLLVLDNCEHVLDGARDLSLLLTVCPNLKILATSREILRLKREWVFPVPPLQVPEPKALPPLETLAQVPSVALFLQRAQAQDPGFALTKKNAPAIVELCVHLDGLPLAIELAAAQIRVLGPEAQLERLSSRLSLADSGARDTPVRHQTLRAAIDWSYALLTEKEKSLFRRLSIFSGWWTLQAAVGICERDGLEADEISPLMARLVVCSLVVASRQADGLLRYRFLETIREYARERLYESGKKETLQRRHRDWFLAWAEEGEPNGWGPGMPEWLDEVEADFNNVWAALEWSRITPGEAPAGLRLWAALARFFDLRGHVTDGLAMANALLPLAPQYTVARARTLLHVCALTRNQGDVAASRLLAEECLKVADELNDILDAAGALMLLGSLAQITGDFQQAEEFFQQAVDVARAHDVHEPRALYMGLYWLGVFYALLGSHDRAVPASEEALVLARRHGDVCFTGTSLAALGRALVGKGDYARAIPVLHEGIRVSQTLNYYELTAYLLDFLGHTAWAQKENEQAVRLLAAAAALRARIGVIVWLPDPDYERIVADLGEGKIRAAQLAAQELPPERVVALALSDEPPRPAPAPAEPVAPPTPGPLSIRELQICGLITEGLSNRRIAEKLHVSKRTVDAHVRHILDKLGLDTRAQVSAWYTEQIASSKVRRQA